MVRLRQPDPSQYRSAALKTERRSNTRCKIHVALALFEGDTSNSYQAPRPSSSQERRAPHDGGRVRSPQPRSIRLDQAHLPGFVQTIEKTNHRDQTRAHATTKKTGTKTNSVLRPKTNATKQLAAATCCLSPLEVRAELSQSWPHGNADNQPLGYPVAPSGFHAFAI